MVIFRRTESREGMDIWASVEFLTGCYGAAPSARIKIIAPLYPDVIQMDVRLPEVLCDLDTAATSLARQCVDIAWRNDLTPWYSRLGAYEGPMDAISLYYLLHPREDRIAA